MAQKAFSAKRESLSFPSFVNLGKIKRKKLYCRKESNFTVT